MSAPEIPGMPMTQVQCPKCQAPMTVSIPQAQVVNQPMYSQVLLIHEYPTLCPACGTGSVPAIVGGLEGIQIRPVPLPPPKSQSAIVPPTPQETQAVKRGINLIKP